METRRNTRSLSLRHALEIDRVDESAGPLICEVAGKKVAGEKVVKPADKQIPAPCVQPEKVRSVGAKEASKRKPVSRPMEVPMDCKGELSIIIGHVYSMCSYVHKHYGVDAVAMFKKTDNASVHVGESCFFDGEDISLFHTMGDAKIYTDDGKEYDPRCLTEVSFQFKGSVGSKLTPEEIRARKQHNSGVDSHDNRKMAFYLSNSSTSMKQYVDHLTMMKKEEIKRIKGRRGSVSASVKRRRRGGFAASARRGVVADEAMEEEVETGVGAGTEPVAQVSAPPQMMSMLPESNNTGNVSVFRQSYNSPAISAIPLFNGTIMNSFANVLTKGCIGQYPCSNAVNVTVVNFPVDKSSGGVGGGAGVGAGDETVAVANNNNEVDLLPIGSNNSFMRAFRTRSISNGHGESGGGLFSFESIISTHSQTACHGMRLEDYSVKTPLVPTESIHVPMGWSHGGPGGD